VTEGKGEGCVMEQILTFLEQQLLSTLPVCADIIPYRHNEARLFAYH
jgi:hypothetical protein